MGHEKQTLEIFASNFKNMSQQYWLALCNQALSRPLQDLRALTWSVGAVTVSAFHTSIRFVCRMRYHHRAFLNSQHQLESAATFCMIDVYVALLPLPRQIAALMLCAVASGALFALWRRLPDDDRARVWKHYGWFTGLTCAGCCMAVLS